jgi:hypothetical protein
MKDQQALGSVYPFIAASVVTENAPIKARGEQFVRYIHVSHPFGAYAQKRSWRFCSHSK